MNKMTATFVGKEASTGKSLVANMVTLEDGKFEVTVSIDSQPDPMPLAFKDASSAARYFMGIVEINE